MFLPFWSWLNRRKPLLLHLQKFLHIHNLTYVYIDFWQNWKKRWFTLCHLDPFNPNSMTLSYYSDSERREKKGSISVTSIVKVCPINGRTKDHIFCIETADKTKLVLKAADARTKNIWLAKLLEGCCKGGVSLSLPLSLSHAHTLTHSDILRAKSNNSSLRGVHWDAPHFELCTVYVVLQFMAVFRLSHGANVCECWLVLKSCTCALCFNLDPTN